MYTLHYTKTNIPEPDTFDDNFVSSNNFNEILIEFYPLIDDLKNEGCYYNIEVTWKNQDVNSKSESILIINATENDILIHTKNLWEIQLNEL